MSCTAGRPNGADEFIHNRRNNQMEIWAKRFTKMALIYLALGVVMGVVIGTQPDWSQRLRFVHIHLNLLDS